MAVRFISASNNSIVSEQNASDVNRSYTIKDESTSLKTLAFSRDENERLLYINYPESILPTTKCFANPNDGNKYLFRTTLKANETVQLFFSHHNRTGSNINYAILVYNPNGGTTARVTASNFGYEHGWNSAEFDPWIDFYNGNLTYKDITGGTSKFLLDWRNIPSSSDPFSGIMRIESNYDVTLTVYAWKGTDTSVMDGAASETQFPYSKTINYSDYDENIDKAPNQKYTGIGKGYYLTTNNTVTYSDVNSKTGGVYYALANCSTQNSNEIIPIAISGTSYEAKKGAASPLNNLGNWGAQYQFKTTLDNRNNSTSQTFRCYIGRNYEEGKFVIKHGNNIGYCSMGLSSSTVGNAYKWNFLEVTVPAGKTEDVIFQLVHATCSSSPIYLQWTK